MMELFDTTHKYLHDCLTPSTAYKKIGVQANIPRTFNMFFPFWCDVILKLIIASFTPQDMSPIEPALQHNSFCGHTYTIYILTWSLSKSSSLQILWFLKI